MLSILRNEFMDIQQWTITCTSKTRIDDKTVVITGGNCGIGKEVAIDLARRGGKIMLCCRNATKAEMAVKDIKEKSGSDQVVFYSMDLSSLQSVRETAAKILESVPCIDILINNAGILDTKITKSVDGYETQFATNHLGHFLFTLLLLKRIQAASAPRIVILSSVAHRVAKFDINNLFDEKLTCLDYYANSKLANLLFAKELSERLIDTNVHVYSLHPGIVKTELFRTWEHEGFGLWKYIIKAYIPWCGKTAVQGAQTVIHCAIDEQVEKETGLYYINCKPRKPSNEAQDMELAKKLWEVSLEMVNF